MLAPARGRADPDPLTGIRISVLGLQEKLGSPPLPSLERKSPRQIVLQGGYAISNIDERVSEERQQRLGVPAEQGLGKLQGPTAGFGFTTRSKDLLGYYIFGAFNRLSGELTVSVQGDKNYEFRGMKGIGYGVSAGLSLRVYENNEGNFAVGGLAGPVYASFRSSFKVVSVDTNGMRFDVDSNLPTYGALGGIQAGWRIAKWLYVNPYAIYYIELSQSCKQGAESQQYSDSSCEEFGFVQLPMSFFSYGLNVGLRNFYVGVYSKVVNDASYGQLKFSNYQASLTIPF